MQRHESPTRSEKDLDPKEKVEEICRIDITLRATNEDMLVDECRFEWKVVPDKRYLARRRSVLDNQNIAYVDAALI